MYNTVPAIFAGDRFFDSIFEDFDHIMKSPKFSFDDSFPPINVYLNSSDNGFYLEMSLVGFKKEWLSVEIDGDKLLVKADVPEQKEEDSKKYIKHRIKASSFEKVYKIAENYDIDALEVNFENGLLTIYAPLKKKEEPNKRIITIK